MITPKVSIIIINWNGKDYLKKCLNSLKKQSIKKVEIIVVDNNSNDGSVEYLKKFYPEIVVKVNKTNLGFAEANNVGYKLAHGENILFLNNDTWVTADFLKHLIKTLNSNKDNGGAQSRIMLSEDKSRLDSIGAYFTNTGFLYHFGFRKKDKPEYHLKFPLYSAKGACMIFKKSVLDKIQVDGELFDSKYFAYSEESDLCHRVWLAGFKIVYEYNSVIYHKVGGTSKKINDSFVQYHSFKNRISSYIKNLGVAYLIRVLPVHIILCLIASLTYFLKGKPGVSIAIQRSLLWNIMNIPDTLRKRKIIQSKIRKVEDKNFLPGLTRPVGLSYFVAHLKGLEGYNE